MSTTHFKKEFETIDLILNTSIETRGVDAFSLSLIKTERQMRKLFTFLIYQYPCFKTKDINSLIETLAKNKNVYFNGFIKGIDAIYNKSIKTLYGSDYTAHLDNITQATKVRNKIFHGQLTGKSLTRKDLIAMTNNLKEWSSNISLCFQNEIGYDGFDRNSYRKSKKSLTTNYKVSITNLADYEKFIKEHCG